MPASFKVDRNKNRNTETLVADFGESAIGRVAPVDSGFWWIILLRAYTKYTGDVSLSESPECQKCMRLILNLCLSEGFDTFPTLLCTDGCSMIDRRMVYTFHLYQIYKQKYVPKQHNLVEMVTGTVVVLHFLVQPKVTLIKETSSDRQHTHSD